MIFLKEFNVKRFSIVREYYTLNAVMKNTQNKYTMNTNLNTQAENLAKPVLTTVFLAPYLSYGLKVIFEGKGGRILEVTGIRKIKTNDIYFSTENETLCIDTFKPILKPLSDLIDNILDDNNDANYQLNCELADLLNTTNADYFVKALIEGTYYAVDHRLWNDIETWLNKNHFDWKFNLIEKGLAISIHDVE